MVSIINTHEYLFSVNEFNEPKVYKDSKAISQILTHLLLLEPGTFQSHPDMGVGLVSKYRYTMEDKITDLKNDFKLQIEKYLPQYQGVQVEVFLQNHICYINVTIDNTIYAFYYDYETDNFQSTFKALADL